MNIRFMENSVEIINLNIVIYFDSIPEYLFDFSIDKQMFGHYNDYRNKRSIKTK